MNKTQYANMMERRQFLKLASMGALGAAALSACSSGNPEVDEAAQDDTLPELEWDLATSWPTSLDTIYGGAQTFADRVGAMTGGKFMITAQPGGEVVPALEILQNIQTNAFLIVFGVASSIFVAAWVLAEKLLPAGAMLFAVLANLQVAGEVDDFAHQGGDLGGVRFSIDGRPDGCGGPGLGGLFSHFSGRSLVGSGFHGHLGLKNGGLFGLPKHESGESQNSGDNCKLSHKWYLQKICFCCDLNRGPMPREFFWSNPSTPQCFPSQW